MLVVPAFGEQAVIVRKLFEEVIEERPARRPAHRFPPVRLQAVCHDAAEPVAKGTRPAVVFESRHLGDDDEQHILHDVVGIGILKQVLTEPASQKRAIDGQKAGPVGGIVAVRDAFEEATRSVEHGHRLRGGRCDYLLFDGD